MFKIALPTSRVELLPGNQAHCPWYILKSFTAQALEYITSFDNAGASSVFPNFVRFNFTAASSSSVAFSQVSHRQSSLEFLCSKIRCCFFSIVKCIWLYVVSFSWCSSLYKATSSAPLCCKIGNALAVKHFFHLLCPYRQCLFTLEHNS